MAKEVWTNGYVLVNGVDLSNQARSCEVTTSTPEVDVTAFGDTMMQYAGGIPDASITVEFFQSQAAGSVDATLWPLATSSSTTFTVEVRRQNAARSATNPGFVMSARMLGDYSPLSGDVGSALTTNATFRNASQTGIQRLTA
jgi:hypothetical protein